MATAPEYGWERVWRTDEQGMCTIVAAPGIDYRIQWEGRSALVPGRVEDPRVVRDVVLE